MSFVLRRAQDYISRVRHPHFVFFGLQVPAPLTNQFMTPKMDSENISVTGKNGSCNTGATLRVWGK